jgi:hypothetical protein
MFPLKAVFISAGPAPIRSPRWTHFSQLLRRVISHRSLPHVPGLSKSLQGGRCWRCGCGCTATIAGQALIKQRSVSVTSLYRSFPSQSCTPNKTTTIRRTCAPIIPNPVHIRRPPLLSMAIRGQDTVITKAIRHPHLPRATHSCTSTFPQ